MNLRTLVLLTLVSTAAAASAQTASSFHLVTLTGLTTTESPSLTYSVSLGSGAKMVYNNKTYNITEVFGVYKVAKTGSYTAATAKTTPSGWSFSGASSGSTSNVVGWTDPTKKNAIEIGQSKSFAYNVLTASTGSTTFTGYHIRVAEKISGNANTLFIYTTAPNKTAPVPEPATMAVMVVGAAGLLRRRRKA